MARLIPTLALAVVLATEAALAVTSPMPFRPGYGLGSWIPQIVIDGMKKEAAMRSRILLADSMEGDAESVARELKLAVNPIENEQDDSQAIPKPMTRETEEAKQKRLTKFRQGIWESKLEAYEQLWGLQEEQLDTLKSAGSTGDAKDAPTTFASNIESPIIWPSSEIVYKDRAFDSIQVSAQFFKVDSNEQRADSSAHSTKIGGSVKKGISTFFGSGSFSAAAAASASSKTTSTMELHTVESTLLLTSFATHRKVRQFETIVCDVDRLLKAWNYYNEDDPIPDPAIQLSKFLQVYMKVRTSSSATKTAPKTISMVTEVYLGSSLVGMVHFIKKERTDSSESNSQSAQEVQTELQMSSWLGSFTGTTSFSNSQATKMASMASQAGLQIKFDLSCLGYIPNLKSSIIKTSVKGFKDFDPSNFDAGKNMPEDSMLAGSTGLNTQQSNMGSVIKATVQSLSEMVSDNPVMDVQTFMNAWDDYAENARTTEGVGIPVGLNVKQYSKADVIYFLGDKYVAPARVARDGGEGEKEKPSN